MLLSYIIGDDTVDGPRGKTCIFSHPVYLFLREFSLQDFRGGSNPLTLLRASNMSGEWGSVSSRGVKLSPADSTRGFRQRWRTCGGVVLADRHMPSEQCGARKMAALRH